MRIHPSPRWEELCVSLSRQLVVSQRQAGPIIISNHIDNNLHLRWQLLYNYSNSLIGVLGRLRKKGYLQSNYLTELLLAVQ